jgi:hypothetical protein
MSNLELFNAAAFKGTAPSKVFHDIDPNSESLADGIGQSYGILGYKGKTWTLRLRGETFQFNRPDDGTPAPFLDVIILRQLPVKSKSYYPAGSYQEGNVGVRPLCASLDGVTPDVEIATPQNNACVTCARNVFKTTADGRKTRECSDFKRLAVLVLPKLTMPFFNGKALMEPVFLRVPPASLNDLSLFGDTMSQQGFHYATFITRIGFKPDKPHPVMFFKAICPLTDQQAPMVRQLRDDMASHRITGEDMLARRPGLPAIAAPAAAAPVQTAPVQTAPNVVQMPPPNKPAAPVATDEGWGAAAAPVTATVTGTPPTDDDGWGGTATAAPAAPIETSVAPQHQQPTAAVSDTMTEEADDDLEARVGALLQR